MKTGKSILYGVFCTILGIVIWIYGIYNLVHYADFYFKGETFDLNQAIANGEEFPHNTYVSFTTNSVLGNYAETKHTYGFIPIGKDEHYIVFLDDDTFMSVTVKGSSKVDQLEKITDETWASDDYYANSYITLVGRITSFTGGELYGYYTDAFSQMGLDTSASDSPVRNISLNATESRGNQWLWEILYFIVGGLILVGGLSSLGVLSLGNKAGAASTAAGGTVVDSYSDTFSGDNGSSASDPFAYDNSGSSYASDPFASSSSSSASDPFAYDNSGSSSTSDPFAYDNNSSSTSASDPFSAGNDTMDSFKNGYDDMMNNMDNTDDNDKNDSSSQGSGLKLKL